MSMRLCLKQIDSNGVFYGKIFTCLIYICPDQLLLQIRDSVLQIYNKSRSQNDIEHKVAIGLQAYKILKDFSSHLHLDRP